MFAVIAAVLFGLALVFQLADSGLGGYVTAATLTTCGMVFVAVHLAAPGNPLRGRRGRR